MSDEHIKHLEFIQGIIIRMAQCSFWVKGWCVTLVSAFLALYAKMGNEKNANLHNNSHTYILGIRCMFF